MAFDWLLALAITGGVALFVGIFVLVWMVERKRRAALAAWALKRGLVAYDAKPELSWLRDFEAWGPGYGHKAFDGYQGQVHGRRFWVFQHQSRTRNKDNEQTHNVTVCTVQAPLAAPNLRIKREHILHKAFDALGGEDIDFESDEFSRKFWVKCDNRRFAYDVIHPRMMEHLLEAPKSTYQWRGDRLVLHLTGSFKPERGDRLMRNAADFLSRLPRHLPEG